MEDTSRTLRDGKPPKTAFKILIFSQFRRQVARTDLRRAVEAAVTQVGKDEFAEREIELVVADDETVQELNRTYRGLDETTDVLAFSPKYHGRYQGQGPEPINPRINFPHPNKSEEPLGEVILSYPQARRQAIQATRPIKYELITLTVHGVLHLLGYDHDDPKEEEIMFRLQEQAVAVALGKKQ